MPDDPSSTLLETPLSSTVSDSIKTQFQLNAKGKLPYKSHEIALHMAAFPKGKVLHSLPVGPVPLSQQSYRKLCAVMYACRGLPATFFHHVDAAMLLTRYALEITDKGKQCAVKGDGFSYVVCPPRPVFSQQIKPFEVIPAYRVRPKKIGLYDVAYFRACLEVDSFTDAACASLEFYLRVMGGLMEHRDKSALFVVKHRPGHHDVLATLTYGPIPLDQYLGLGKK